MWKLFIALTLLFQLTASAAVTQPVNEVALNCDEVHVDEDREYLECYLLEVKSSNDKVTVTSSNVDMDAKKSQNTFVNVDLTGNVNYPQYFPLNLAEKLKGIRNFLYTSTPLKFIKREDFKEFGSELILLRLEENDIEDIPFDTFYDLTSLVYLDVSYNKIKTLDTRLFVNSPNFDSLFIRSNQLTEINPDMLNICPEFHVLYAEFNIIEKIDENLFQNNPNMSVISMRHNKIKNIPIDFTRFAELHVADFTHNAGTCDTMYFMSKPYVEYYDDNEQKKWIKTVPEFQKKIEEVCRQ